MNKFIRLILTITLLAGAALSVGIQSYLLIRSDREVFGEWLAPVHVNIEMDKNYANNLSIYSEAHEDQYYYLSPTTVNDYQTTNVVMHTQLKTNGMHRKIYIRMPEDKAYGIINTIDNMSVFVGNKLFYFSKDEIQAFNRKNEDDHTLFKIPDLYYSKSILINDWANYYGDFNIALKVFCGFLLYPGRFIPTYLFLFGLLFLYREQLKSLYSKIKSKSALWTILCLLLVTVFAFLLRINGYVRHSGWTDEIYSATHAGNPLLPFSVTFSDSGNPPFYFILLRFWFKLFNWSEEAGTLLSVILGTCAIPAIYILVKQNFNKRAALIASCFMCISGFAIGYSQEMRSYIVLVLLTPIAAIFFLNFLKYKTLNNLIFYILSSMCLVNSHYYGILFIMANFIFYYLYQISNRSFNYENIFLFLIGNIAIALSFMPFFLYQVFVQKYYFDRTEIIMYPYYYIILLIILVLTAIYFRYRNKTISVLHRVFKNNRMYFFLYVLFIPILIFILALIVSIKKPMISFRYLMPVSFSFFLSLTAILLSLSTRHNKLKFLTIFLVWAVSIALYSGKPGIPGGGYEYYRESRTYIAADAAAHPENRSAMLNNAPQNAHYYGFADMPEYSPDDPPDVLYVFNTIFNMHEQDMYRELDMYGLDDTNMLKIYPSDSIVIFKKHF
jgi:uncharacterized membrane protein